MRYIFNLFKNEILGFLSALIFLTKFPIPGIPFRFRLQQISMRYYSLIGLFIGFTGFLVFSTANIYFSKEISVLFCMSFTMLLTGALHEDGLCDFIDGFGGGSKKEDILRIMKDPSIGTFGSAGLILMLLFKFLALKEINASNLLYVLVFSHSASRLFMLAPALFLEYARTKGKSGNFSETVSTFNILFNMIVPGVLALFFGIHFLFIILLLVMISSAFSFFIYKKIGGYTGDCLGALQQISELLVYFIFLLKPGFYI